MDKTKSKLAVFFDEDEEESSFPPKKVDEHKLSQYTQGTSRKSKREKEKEAAEIKRKEEEEHAARAYAEFLETFEGGVDDTKKKGFVRSSTDSGAAYLPHVSSASPSTTSSFRPNPMTAPRPPSPPGTKPKGKRAMDSFLEEIKREQAEREAKYSRHTGHGRSVTAMAAYEGQSGSKDRGDPETTNIFVANLPNHVTEQSLGNFFARTGPVGSVKIMWPRGDATHGPGGDMTASRRSKSTGFSGFVSFMKRKDAEAALREFDGFDWGGSILRVGWSKAVPVSSKALYTASKPRSRSRSRSRGREHDGRSHSRSNSRLRSNYRGSRRSSKSRSWSRSPSRSPQRQASRRSYSRSRRYSYSRSRSPHRRRSSPDEKKSIGDDDVTDEFIRTVAAEVKGRGSDFEKMLKERERGNPKYLFLIDHRHRRHNYYRSLVQSNRTMEAEFDDEGYNSVYSTDSAEDSERERVRKHHLGRLARRRFEAMLRALSGRRGELARCMAFSLEHAEAASEVVDIIISSLLVIETPVPRKVARLHLICDILHNSAAPLPMAWKFRQEFQTRLGLVFDHLSTIYHSFPGRITAETFKKQILSVVEIWEDWIVFSPDYTMELRSRLDGTVAEDQQNQDEAATVQVKENTPDYSSRFKASSFKPADPNAAGEGDEEQDMEIENDVDGQPVEDDVDGEPIGDLDGEPMGDDLDGEPMARGDVDGESMDEDIDGAPIQ